MSFLKEMRFPLALLSIIFAAVTITYFFPTIPVLGEFSQTMSTWTIVISAVAFLLGHLQMTIIQYKVVKRRVKGRWPYALWLIFCSWFTFVAALISTPIATGAIFKWIVIDFKEPVITMTSALAALFMASAAYRTMRARNWEGGLLIICMALVMLRNAPIGGAIWPGFSSIGSWIMDIPTKAGMRAFLITGGLGAILLALRTLLGRERGALGG
jgi:hypothetical protein